MDERGGDPLATPALVGVLLDQGLVGEARELLARLERSRPGDERVSRLIGRLEELEAGGEPLQESREARGADEVALEIQGDVLDVRWELTRASLELARRMARCSGGAVVRLFTVTTGPRGARKASRDLVLAHDCGRVRLRGLPRPAVHVAAAGFLARSGVFLPLCTCSPVGGSEP